MQEELHRLKDVDALRIHDNQKHANVRILSTIVLRHLVIENIKELGVLRAQFDQTHGLYCFALKQLESVEKVRILPLPSNQAIYSQYK